MYKPHEAGFRVLIVSDMLSACVAYPNVILASSRSAFAIDAISPPDMQVLFVYAD